jgi:hypothetical protein
MGGGVGMVAVVAQAILARVIVEGLRTIVF